MDTTDDSGVDLISPYSYTSPHEWGIKMYRLTGDETYTKLAQAWADKLQDTKSNTTTTSTKGDTTSNG